MPFFQHQWSVLGRDAMTSHPLERNQSQVPGLGHQVPGSGVQHQVQVQARLFGSHFCTSYPAPVPEPDNPYLAPDCRDPRPETSLCLSPLHLCTGAPLRFAPLHVLFASLANWPTDQRINSCALVRPTSPPVLASSVSPPCPHVPLPTCPLLSPLSAIGRDKLPPLPILLRQQCFSLGLVREFHIGGIPFEFYAREP